jgi:eukaryotic-like serine/threonine-protein kinase
MEQRLGSFPEESGHTGPVADQGELFRWPFLSLVSTPAAGLEAAAVPEGDAPKEQKAEHPRWDLEAGTPIAEGRWVLERLGGGSRYEVYLVWDDRLFALTVAKILRPDQTEDARALRELRHEAEVLERLAHPVLVRGFGAVLEGPYPHVLLEHLEGPTLRRLIKRDGALPLEQLLPLTLHIAAVLHYLAAAGTVHLDVKPDNIVMGIPPRLIDLSIARSVETAARLRAAIGTDAYMAPEQCDPESWPGAIGPAADVWGLGATLYHAITGGVPFPRPSGARESADPTVRFPQLVHEPDPLPKDVPALLGDLILKMLTKQPAERPAAGELASVLEPLVAELPSRLTVSRHGIRAHVNPKDRLAARDPPALPQGNQQAPRDMPADAGAKP